MAWRALVLADIETALSAQELTAVRTLALAGGQTDPTTPVIASAMDEVRGYILGSRNITLGAEGTIPDKLIVSAVDIAVWQLVTRFPTKLLATEARRQRYTDAIQRLKDVANNKFRVEIPTVTSTETVGVLVPSISQCGVRQRIRWEDREI